MSWDLDKKNGIPLYLQIKEEIKEKIKHKVLEEGCKLPTERDLAKSLNVSRNTVSAAYKELEAEGILTSQQGKGTFVADSGNFYKREGCKERLLKMIDLAMEEAIELGFSLDHFVSITYGRVQEKEQLLANLQIAFVECNNEQLYVLAEKLEEDLGVRVFPILLKELKEAADYIEDKLANIDMVVTTLFHYDEVETLVAKAEKQAIALPLNAQLETLIKIAQIPKGKKVGLACFSPSFEARVKNSLASVGISKINILATTAQGEKELKEFLTQVDLVVASPEKKKKIQGLLPPQMEIIELIYLPDPGMVSRLKTILLELKKEWRVH